MFFWAPVFSRPKAVTAVKSGLGQPLRTQYLDFDELFEKGYFFSIHLQNIRHLAVEMFKVFSSLSPEIIEGVFRFRGEVLYNLRQRSQFHIPSVHKVFNGSESIKFLGPKIWKVVRDEMKQLESLGEFRKTIKQLTHCLWTELDMIK